MDREELLNKLKEIGTCEDDVKRRELLTEVTDNVSTVYEQYTHSTEDLKKIKEDNEKLGEANMKLFLRVGESKSPEESTKEKTGIDNKDPEPRKFESLFDEKGMIK